MAGDVYDVLQHCGLCQSFNLIFCEVLGEPDIPMVGCSNPNSLCYNKPRRNGTLACDVFEPVELD